MFQAGDRVRIKTGCKDTRDCYFEEDMKKYEGKETQIASVRGMHWYKLVADNSEYVWEEEWLEPVVEKTSYQASIEELLQKQVDKGGEHYGRTLEEWDADIETKLTYAQEECVDELFYLEHLKATVVAKMKALEIENKMLKEKLESVRELVKKVEIC